MQIRRKITNILQLMQIKEKKFAQSYANCAQSATFVQFLDSISAMRVRSGARRERRCPLPAPRPPPRGGSPAQILPRATPSSWRNTK